MTRRLKLLHKTSFKIQRPRNLVNKATLVQNLFLLYLFLVYLLRVTNTLRMNCAPSWLYLQDYTEMHGQQNIKKPRNLILYFWHQIRLSVVRSDLRYTYSTPFRIMRTTKNRLFQDSVSQGERNRNKVYKDSHRHTILFGCLLELWLWRNMSR
jgi:hypothetical protein